MVKPRRWLESTPVRAQTRWWCQRPLAGRHTQGSGAGVVKPRRRLESTPVRAQTRWWCQRVLFAAAVCSALACDNRQVLGILNVWTWTCSSATSLRLPHRHRRRSPRGRRCATLSQRRCGSASAPTSHLAESVPTVVRSSRCVRSVIFLLEFRWRTGWWFNTLAYIRTIMTGVGSSAPVLGGKPMGGSASGSLPRHEATRTARTRR